MRIVPLESNGEQLIGEVDNLLFTKDRIIATDMRKSKSVHIFDLNGKELAVINRLGPGPEEYTHPSYTTLTPDEKQIAIYDNGGSKVLFFDLDGNFIERKNVEFSFWEFEYIDEDNIVCVSYGTDDKGLEKSNSEGALVIFTDGDFNIKTSTLYNIQGKKVGFPIVPELKKMNGEILLNPAFSDTIYRVSPGSLDPHYHLDLAPIGGIANLDARTTAEEFSDIMGNKILFYGEFPENDSFLLFGLSEKRQVRAKIFDKHTKELFSLGYGDINNSARVGWFDESVLSSKYIVDNQFVAVVQAYHILRCCPSIAKQYPQLTGLTDNSNPVLVFTKFKNPNQPNN